jgi:hypothetical protein
MPTMAEDKDGLHTQVRGPSVSHVNSTLSMYWVCVEAVI